MAEQKSVEDIFSAFGDLFGQFFANSPHLAATLELTDAEAAGGTTRELAITRRSPCTICNGRGTASETTESKPCTKCSGKGQLTHQQGFFMVQTACAECKGVGSIIKDPCTTCSGTRVVSTPATVTVTVPPDCGHGGTLCLKGAGSKLADGTVGDLNVYLLVGGRPDPRAAAFEPPPAELPRATVRGQSARIPWGVIGAVAVILMMLLLFAR